MPFFQLLLRTLEQSVKGGGSGPTTKTSTATPQLLNDLGCLGRC